MAIRRFAFTVVLILCCLPAHGQDAEHYRTPIVFQRFSNSEANPTVPGFYGGAEIWIVESDGSRLQQFRSDPERHLDHPSLTDDLLHVIYAEFDPGGSTPRDKARLMIESIGINAAGKSTRRTLRDVTGCTVHHAALSPTTEELTYSRYCDDGASALISEMNDELRDAAKIVAADGLRAANGVSTRNTVVFQAEGSPERGSRRASIASIHWDEDGNHTLHMLTQRDHLHRRPAVSPDGQWVAWQSNDSNSGTDDILLARMDGTQRTRVTRSPANDGHPWFSRDGRTLVFESDRTGNWEIFTIALDGSAVRQITDDPAFVSTRPRF